METITGFVDHIVFQNSENGYTVMILSTEGEEMTCVGMCKGLTQGENISAEGEYIEHPVYGRQFKIQSYETVTPTDRVGMERYLGSGAIRGVGEALAARIVKKFGDDTFRIIEEEPERLAEVKGISERKAQEIALQMEEKKDLREALVYLQQYGISNTLAVKIYNTYGMEMYSVMRENPYRLAEDVVVWDSVSQTRSRGRSAFIPTRITASAVAFCIPCCRRWEKVIVICRWIFCCAELPNYWGYQRKISVLRWITLSWTESLWQREKQYLLPLITMRS